MNVASEVASATSMLTPLGTLGGYFYGRMQGRGTKITAQIEKDRRHDERIPTFTATLVGGPECYTLSLRLNSICPLSSLYVSGMKRGVPMFFGPEDPDEKRITKVGHGNWTQELRKAQEAKRRSRDVPVQPRWHVRRTRH